MVQPIPVRPEVFKVLRRLRRHIRQYVFLEGTALVLVLLAGLFWFSLGLDWAYFQLRSLELPVWFRKAFAVSTVCLFALSFTTWVALRLLRSFRVKALALVLERRFPELDDRLITAVEFAENCTEQPPALTAAMLNRTLDEAARTVRNIELGAVFDKTPLGRAAVAAVTLVASVVAFGWANKPAMARWTRAFVNWEDEYWDRRTLLTVKVIAQPGDRIRQFDDLLYRHPRGGDLTLLVEVPEGKQVPERVRLQYRLAGGRGGGSAYLSKLGKRRFKHTVTGLLDDMQLWVRGGDFLNRRPYQVLVVDPPRIDRITFENDYPDYTGLDSTDDRGNPVRDQQIVRGTQISVPMETHFLMHGRSNKPLLNVRIETDAFEVRLSEQGVRLALLRVDGEPHATHDLPAPAGEPWFILGSRSFHLPFQLTAEADARLESGSPAPPIPLPSHTPMRIYLNDVDGVTSLEPERLTVSGVLDQPPVVETQLRGIGASVTRKAVIPIEGTISDDYGIVDGRFEFRLDDSQSWQPRPLRRPPADRPTEFQLQRADDQPFEQFEILPLDLTIGQKLALTVYARDGDNLNGPHESRGQRYTFQIVSREELLSILYGKELNLRRRLEQIIKEVQDTEQDLVLHRTRVEEAAALSPQASGAGQDGKTRQEIEEIRTAVTVAGERALHQVRKNANETAAIEESFKEILEELVNNAVHTRQMVDRIEGLIIDPLTEINTVDYPQVDESISLFTLANDQGEDPTPQIDASRVAIGTLLRHMKAVLNEMQDLVNFHSAVSRLKTIIEEERKLNEETRQHQKKQLIDKLKDLNLD